MASLPHIPQAQSFVPNPAKEESERQAPSSTSAHLQTIPEPPLSNEPAFDPSVSSHPNPILSSKPIPRFTDTTAPPPHLHTPTSTEPADEWASNTLNAVSHPDGGPASNVSTPGPAIPGAFPAHLPIPTRDVVAKDVEMVRDAALSALGTAKDYIVAGGQRLYPYVNTAGQTVYRGAEGAGEKAAQGAVAAKDGVAERAAVAGQTVVAGATTAKDSVASGASAAGQTAVSGATTARDTAVSGAVSAKDTVVGGGQRVSSTGSGIGSKVYSIVETAGDTVAPYLPATVASYIPHRVENNTDHIQPSTGIVDPTGNPKNGLQSLEGTSFAKLPEEAMQPQASTTTTFPTDNPKNGLEGVSGTNLARLPEESMAQGAGTTTTFPTANPKNGLEGVSGTNLAKLPEESKVEHGGRASYLNPALASAPETAAKPVALAPPNVQHNQKTPVPSTTSIDADTDASTRTLPGSLLTGAGFKTAGKKHETDDQKKDDETHHKVPEKKSTSASQQSSGDPNLETLREHDATAKSEHPKATDTLVTSLRDKEKKHSKDAAPGTENKVTHSKGTSDGRTFDDAHRGTGANKPLNEGVREHALGAPGSKFQPQNHNANQHHDGPPVPEKPAADPSAQRGDSNVATAGHSPARGRSVESPRVSMDQGSVNTAKKRASGGSFGSDGSKKVGFMNKVKGEMKVLSGKMSGKEEKVEEGRRIMGKN